MTRKLGTDEQALWAKVAATVKPLHRPMMPAQDAVSPRIAVKTVPTQGATLSIPPQERPLRTQGGLDGGWDRRLGRGLVQPDRVVDLHGHNQATAYALLDGRLEEAISAGSRIVLLITGKPPRDDHRPAARGAIRAAVGDWLAASRHAAAIAAVRPAHPRHGGAGALYLVLRRRHARYRQNS